MGKEWADARRAANVARLAATLADALVGIPHLSVPARDPREQFVASSLQFSVVDLPHDRIARFIEDNAMEIRTLFVIQETWPWNHPRYASNWQVIDKDGKRHHASALGVSS